MVIKVMKIERHIITEMLEKLRSTDKALILYGPRQVGKTTLCRDIAERLAPARVLFINAEEQQYQKVLSSRNGDQLARLVSGYDLLIIDEAQRIKDIGVNLKILIDRKLPLKIIATGSSSFDLANYIQEPLTGRHLTFFLYPIAMVELARLYNPFELTEQIPTLLQWGSYPDILTQMSESDRHIYMNELMRDYLYKDVLAFQTLRYPDKLHDLLKLLAFQIGSLVSLSELASQLDMSKETVHRYLDLLEKTFVIFKMRGFSRNLRKEVTKNAKYYFYDVGIRNAIIGNHAPLEDRNDVGHIWENFLISERMKRNRYTRHFAEAFFWRTHTGAEVDYVEHGNGATHGFEFTWSEHKNKKEPPSWRALYPDAEWTRVDKSTWQDFVL